MNCVGLSDRKVFAFMYGPSTVRGLCVMVEGQILSLPPNQTQSLSICFKVLNILILCLIQPRFKSYFITRLKLLKGLSWVLEWWVLVCESVLGDLKALCFRECNDWVLFNPNQSNPRGHSEKNKISWVADERSKFKCTSSVKGGLNQWPRSY